jgi:hypothetical protein
MIRIKFNSKEFNFEYEETAAHFLLLRRKDGNEFCVSWVDDGEVSETETWLYLDPVFDDQEYGEFKCSPHGSSGDFDTDCTFIESRGEVVKENLARV